MIKSKHIFIVAFLAVVNALFIKHVKANEFNFSGFATIGGVQTNSSQYGYRADMSQNIGAKSNEFRFTPVSNLGVQFDYSINEHWDAVAQLVYKKQDKYGLDNLAQLAFVRYKVSPQWSFRAGRTAIDVFQLSDVREVGIAYPWVVVPNEVYGFVPNRSTDGFDATYSGRTDLFSYSVKGFYGKTESDFSSSTYDPVFFDDLTGIKLELSSYSWLFAARYTEAAATNSSDNLDFYVELIPTFSAIFPAAPELANQLDFTNKQISYGSIYAMKAFGNYEVSAEWVHIDSETLPIEHIENGFINLSYLMNGHTFYVTYSMAESEEYYFDEIPLDSPISRDIAFVIEEVVAIFRHNQETFSIGWRWDVSESLAVKLQWQKVNVDERGGGLQKSDKFRVEGTEESFNNVFAAVSFSF
ncbi:hypothetical protein [Psychrosphaera aestuarii]|uniref:hypothetical protein n=1 Tax=Psychrosphaera aestuarii TaxID=1266052 RepID=UPI001B33A97C|nr:hypothetical protein [Psychrosphaera aestuarii]